jgi:hypothetical protein
MIKCDGHDDNVSSHRMREDMAKTSQVPTFVRLGNVLTTTLLRAGFKLVGPGDYPMYLLTVRGRKSGQPRTIPIVVLVTLALLILAVMAVFTSELRRLGAVGIVYALILPIFGATQQMILPGDLHWLIQATHLIVSFSAIPFIDNIRARYLSLKRTAAKVTGQPQPVR